MQRPSAGTTTLAMPLLQSIPSSPSISSVLETFLRPLYFSLVILLHVFLLSLALFPRRYLLHEYQVPLESPLL